MTCSVPAHAQTQDPEIIGLYPRDERDAPVAVRAENVAAKV
jgi:hypothetical protein